MRGLNNLFKKNVIRLNRFDFIEIGLQPNIINDKFVFQSVLHSSLSKYSRSEMTVPASLTHHLFQALNDASYSTFFEYANNNRQAPDLVSQLIYTFNGMPVVGFIDNSTVSSLETQQTIIYRICDYLNYVRTTMEFKAKLLKDYIQQQNLLSIRELLASGNEDFNTNNDDELAIDMCIYAEELFEEYLSL